jgi:Zn-dependent protease with chaperone function
MTFRTIAIALINMISYLFPLIISLALLYFLWGVAKYVAPSGSERASTEGRDMMVYGVIGFAVASSMWGLVHFLIDSFLGPTGI